MTGHTAGLLPVSPLLGLATAVIFYFAHRRAGRHAALIMVGAMDRAVRGDAVVSGLNLNEAAVVQDSVAVNTKAVGHGRARDLAPIRR
jgi:hypothetical protein